MVKRIDFISAEEFEKLYRAEKRREMKLAMLLMFGSGLRLSEVIGLEAEENIEGKIKRKKGEWKISPLTEDKIDFQTKQIRIDKAKGNKWRVVPVPKALREDMVKLLPLKINRRTFQKRIESLSLKVLGKKISPHTLRHGFGNYIANTLKLPLPMAQQFLGHKKLETTGIYTKVNPQAAIAEYWKNLEGGK